MIKTVLIMAIILAVGALFVTGWPTRHLGPPDLAKGLISEKDWTDTGPASVRLTTYFRRRFPPRTRIETFKAALADEGFRPQPKFQSCHSDDRHNPKYWCETISNLRMEYYWGALPCDEWVFVDWSGDGHDQIGQLTAGYGKACI